MNPIPNGVVWTAKRGDLLVCVDAEYSGLLLGECYECVTHNREAGLVTVKVDPGGDVAFTDRRFSPLSVSVSEPKKNDQDKPRMDILLSIHGIDHIGHVFSHGAKKYDEFNWRKGGNSEPFKRRMAAAAIRHITAYLQGTKMDEESKEPHLAHAIADLLMILDLEETK